MFRMYSGFYRTAAAVNVRVRDSVSCQGLQDVPEDLSLPWRWLILFSFMVGRDCG